MRAVILCGGTGSRLRPLTEVRPKPMMRLMNNSVLESIIRRLEDEGVGDISLSLGFMAHDIISACESMRLNVPVRYCEESKPLGTAGGVKNCLHECGDTVLVVSGDNIFDIDLRAAEDFHKKNGADFTVVGKKVADPREYGCIIKDPDNRILSFIEKPDWENADSFLINTGIYIFNGELLDMIPENTFYDFAENLFPDILRQNKKFMCFDTDGFWGDIGEFDAYISLSEKILREYTTVFPVKGSLILHNETDEYGNEIIAPCVIGEKTLIGRNNRIGPCTVIGKATHIGDKCCIEGAMIGDECRIGDSTDILKAVVDDNVNVGANCVIESGAVVGYGATVGKFSRLFSGVKIWPGKTIPSESVINKDMFYESPTSLEFDVFGISGKVFSQFTLSDAVKIAQALSSLKHMEKIGVSCDGKNASDVYRGLLCAGIISCGTSCYDFGESFMAQSYFYAAYCGLDAFVYVSTEDDVVNLCFLGKNGLPLETGKTRKINNNYRFSSFVYADPDKTGILYRMSLLSTSYDCSLRKLISTFRQKTRIGIECENKKIKKTLESVFSGVECDDAKNSLQFLLNPLGTDMYCMENDRFFASDRIRAVLCELEFAAGNDVIVPENASLQLEKTAEKYGRKVFRVFENGHAALGADRAAVLDDLWNFDALHLCVKLVGILASANTTMADLCAVTPDFSMRSRIVDLGVAPSAIREKIENAGGTKASGAVYYDMPVQGGGAKIRQLGNTSRVRMLVEAADMEAAKDIMTGVSAKFVSGDIDNKLI